MFITEPLSSVASWTLTSPADGTSWRHIRVKINGPNASGQTHYLSLSGLELYGEVRGLADEDLGRLGVMVRVIGLCLYMSGNKVAILNVPYSHVIRHMRLYLHRRECALIRELRLITSSTDGRGQGFCE